MPNLIVYLIRHSIPISPLKDGRRLVYGSDALLTAEGKQKAVKLAGAMLDREGKALDALYSSPVQRAYETAQILADQMKLAGIQTNEDLREADSLWAGTPVDEFMQIFTAGQTYEDPRSRESIAEIAARMSAAFRRIAASHDGQLIGIVSHSDPLRILIDRLRHPDREIPAYLQLNRELLIDTAQAVRLEFLPDGQIQTEMVPDQG